MGRRLLGLAVAVLAAMLAGRPAAAQIAPPRTLEELRADTILRAEEQNYPLTGIHKEDAAEAVAHLTSLDPDNWADAWIPLGDRVMAQARQASGDEAKETFRYAFALYSVGRFPFPGSPEKQLAYRRALEAYRAWNALVQPAMETIRIPFEGKEIVGYLRLPPGPGPHPVVLSMGGLDYLKEQVAEEGLTFLPHGIGTFAVDMPGTGEAPIKADVGAERMFSRILDWFATRPDIDPKRVIIRGVSWGGYWATRVAILERARLLAASSQGGPVDRFFTPEWQLKALGTREYLMDLFGARSNVFGTGASLDAFLAFGPHMSLLTSGLIDQPSAPMLLVNGAQDSQVPISDLTLLLMHGSAKEAFVIPGAGHVGRGAGWTPKRVNDDVVIPWMLRMIVAPS